MEWITPQQVLDRCCPGGSQLVQGRLVRLSLNPLRQQGSEGAHDLAFLLCRLVSIKGEDVLLTSPSDRLVKAHRLRAGVPAKLRRWKVVAGWKWTFGAEHINALELRAILPTIRWQLEHNKQVNSRLVHLTDSMVCLHVLSRGRTSSRKLILARVNALTLAGNLAPVWAYVHTGGAGEPKPSLGMPKRKLLEATQPSERAAQRQRLGTLRELTVQPATKRRYQLATSAFFKFLKEESLTLPRELSQLDALVCDYIERLCASGTRRAQANDTVAGLQDLQPSVRGKLPGTWRLLKTWSINEIANRAPPLPEHVLLAMVGWSLFNGRNLFSALARF